MCALKFNVGTHHHELRLVTLPWKTPITRREICSITSKLRITAFLSFVASKCE